ncbi:MAG TPA: DUF488 domain-containing protein [Vicinamibacterales bacterium]|nr:DUF488 domain-containing protein [Vicinamibacterales bacterium]
MTVFTIGHSTRTLDDFVALLRVHHVTQLADVRRVPKSRRHPHFAADALARSLPPLGIAYRHFPALGGLRKPRKDSPNTAWRHGSFRGYADYMATDEFKLGVNELVAWAAAALTAVMCAEAVWWQCHRQLIADALVARGLDVRHILSAASAPAHRLTDFARVDASGGVTYPGLV